MQVLGGRPRRPDRLDARVLDRVEVPAFVRSPRFRRIVAAALVAVALADLATNRFGESDRVPVVVAAHELRPGTSLSENDVRVTDIDPAVAPAGAVATASAVVGRTVAGPVGAGEMLTDLRLLGPRLAGASVESANPRVVPVTLADAGVADVVRVGDRVDVLTVSDAGGADAVGGAAGPPGATVLADGATVVLVTGTDDRGRSTDRVVLLAMDAATATAVAAASLVSAVTVTFH